MVEHNSGSIVRLYMWVTLQENQYKSNAFCMSFGLNLLSLTPPHTHMCHRGCSWEAYVTLSPCAHICTSLSETHTKGCEFCRKDTIQEIGKVDPQGNWRTSKHICTLRIRVLGLSSTWEKQKPHSSELVGGADEHRHHHAHRLMSTEKGPLFHLW